jgi:hypothetical protein
VADAALLTRRRRSARSRRRAVGHSRHWRASSKPLFKGHTGESYSSLRGQVPADRPLVALGAGKLIKLPPDNGRRCRRPRAEEVVLRFAFKRALLNANEQSNLRHSDVNLWGRNLLARADEVIE